MSKILNFVHFETLVTKTQRWEVRLIKGGSLLGLIRWIPEHKQFCFCSLERPLHQLVLTPVLLREIADFIENEIPTLTN